MTNSTQADPLETGILEVLEMTYGEAGHKFTDSEKDYIVRKMIDSVFNETQELAAYCLQVRELNKGSYWSPHY